MVMFSYLFRGIGLMTGVGLWLSLVASYTTLTVVKSV
jgi:hypothetical protein